MYEEILRRSFTADEQSFLRGLSKQDSVAARKIDDVSSEDDEYAKAKPINVEKNMVLWLECKEGVTLWTVLSMFSVFFTSFAFSSYCFFVLIFIFEDSAYFHMGPARALQKVAWLLFASYPFNVISSMLTGYLFVKFGRKNLILAGFALSITGALAVAFSPNIQVLYLFIVLIHIGSAWT